MKKEISIESLQVIKKFTRTIGSFWQKAAPLKSQYLFLIIGLVHLPEHQ